MKGLQNPRPTPEPRAALSVTALRLFLTAAVCATASEAADVSATGAVAVFRGYCVQCHGEAAATAGIDLKRLTSRNSIADSFQHWRKVQAVLEQKRMPPQGMPQPSEAERRLAVEWIRTELNEFAEKHDGEPGRVTLRRLTSGEYAYTIRDLTGLDFDVERHFAGDAVGGEGFTNFGDVQFMADADIESYLEEAKRIADHAVIGAGPLSFYQDPGMSGFELSAIHRIHDLYRRHGFRMSGWSISNAAIASRFEAPLSGRLHRDVYGLIHFPMV